MKVKFLGTSFGAPSRGRHEQSILIETKESAYLIDAGAPVLDILVNEGYDLSRIRAVFLSHSHGDHLNGVFDLLYLAAYFGMSFDLYLPSAPCRAFISSYLSLQSIEEGERIRLMDIAEGGAFSSQELSVFAYPTAHTDKSNPTFGFLFESEGKRVYISSDLGSDLSDLPSFILTENTDLCIVECAHFSVETLMRAVMNWKAKRIAVIHVMPSEKYGELSVIATDSKSKLLLPSDMDEIII